MIEIPFLFTLTPTLSLPRLKTGSSTREREFLTFYEFIKYDTFVKSHISPPLVASGSASSP